MKVTKISNQPYPTWEIDLSKLDSYSEILGIMKELGISDYVYTFKRKGEIIKHGYSADKQRNYGERIYRQSGNLRGWDSKLQGSSGKDMIDIDAEYHEKTGCYLDRKDMTITVRDLSDIISPNPNDPLWPIKQLERQLIKEHEEMFGRPPIGNVKNEKHMDHSTYTPATILKDLFEFV